MTEEDLEQHDVQAMVEDDLFAAASANEKLKRQQFNLGKNGTSLYLCLAHRGQPSCKQVPKLGGFHGTGACNQGSQAGYFSTCHTWITPVLSQRIRTMPRRCARLHVGPIF
jgi:hypothetical protein